MLDHKKKIRYLRMALLINDINISEKKADLFINIYDTILEKEENFNLRDIAMIEAKNKENYKQVKY